MELFIQFKNYLTAQKKQPSKATVRNYSSDIKFFIKWFEKKYFSSLDPKAIDESVVEYFKRDNSESLAASSLKRHISSIRKFLFFLKEAGYISKFPFEKKLDSSINGDPLHLRGFKNYLYSNGSSSVTIKNYLIDIRQFLGWTEEVTQAKRAWNIENQNIFNKINPEIIEEYKNRLLFRGFSPRTINRKLSSIRNFVRWAIKEKIIENEESFRNISKKQSLLPRKSFLTYPLRKAEQAKISQEKSQDFRYSKFPPLRIVQKSTRLANSSLRFLQGYINLSFGQLEYIFWLFKKKPIFKEDYIKITTTPPSRVLGVPNIKKSFYAPFAVSTKYFSLPKRITYHLLHTRPKWYLRYRNNPIAHYIHFSLLVIFMSLIGFGIYQKFFQDTHLKKGVLGELTFAAPRVLTFKDKLTDSFGRPITKEVISRFSIYNDPQASGSSLLWQEVDNIKPNDNGEFSVTLGNKNQIPQNIFLAYPSLWLGITIGQTEELYPRKQISNVSLASNAQKLRGLDPITNGGYSNVVLALDSSGNLSIGGETVHTFQTLDSQFIISGNVLTLTTALGSNTNIELSPDGLGKIDLQKPIHNSSNNNNIQTAVGSVEIDDLLSILATSSGQSALTINQNDIGPLISASSSGIAKFTVDNLGNMTVGGDIILSGINPIISVNSQASGLSVGANGKGIFTIQSASFGDIQFFSALNTLSSTGDLKISGNLNLGGNIGFGTTNPSFRLDVQDSQAATAAAQIFNTNTGTDADGLIIKLGNASTTAVDNTNHFISFETSGIGIVGSIGGNGKGVRYQTSGIADFAEYMKKDKNQNIDFGSVLCLNTNGLVYPCDKESGNIVGVASEHPSFLGGENLGERSIPVGLVGEVLTKVSNINGGIKPGDLLTSSSVPGIAEKAVKPTTMVGRALESFDSSDCTTSYSPENFGLVESNKICTGKIFILLNIGYYDPNPPLVSAFEKVKDDVFSGINNINSLIVDNLIVDNLSVGIIKARDITSDSLNVTSGEVLIGGKKLKDYLTQIIEDVLSKNQTNIISPIASIEEIHTNVISPLAQGNLTVKLGSSENSSFVIQNSSGSAVVTIDSSGNATFSGSLSTLDASVSGILRARKIIADEIENIATPEANISNYIDISTFSSQFIYIDNLKAATASFTQGLIALGPSSVTDISVAGQLSIGTNLILADSTINVLGHDLEIQPLKQGGISFLSGLIYIDIDGNLKVSGNAEFAKNVTVWGKLASNIIAPIPNQDLIVNLGNETDRPSNLVIKNSTGSAVFSINQLGDLISSGSGTFSKLNLTIAKPALAVSETQIIATGSSGLATISAYQKELTINNSLVTEKSLIYITPRINTDNIVLFLLRQIPGLSFTIGINTPLSKNIPFNWLIIN
ncbi:MAG: hypothetical protein A3B44_02530 [Candidatus Levybacteria bacterium RIFCSPLOWO2_01_FULL_38_21]|nr:MAG: hypothetical protein A3B44_02530 [Candidatus Levybacteria bacterium RIFCSPLOWO2_01_FULL_38_21]